MTRRIGLAGLSSSRPNCVPQLTVVKKDIRVSPASYPIDLLAWSLTFLYSHSLGLADRSGMIVPSKSNRRQSIALACESQASCR
jgi:hypothetical protein